MLRLCHLTRCELRGGTLRAGPAFPALRREAQSRLRPVALFVFLAGSAGAGIVAAYLLLRAHNLLNLLRLTGSGHARLFQFAALAAHEGFFELVGRG